MSLRHAAAGRELRELGSPGSRSDCGWSPGAFGGSLAPLSSWCRASWLRGRARRRSGRRWDRRGAARGVGACAGPGFARSTASSAKRRQRSGSRGHPGVLAAAWRVVIAACRTVEPMLGERDLRVARGRVSSLGVSWERPWPLFPCWWCRPAPPGRARHELTHRLRLPVWCGVRPDRASGPARPAARGRPRTRSSRAIARVLDLPKETRVRRATGGSRSTSDTTWGSPRLAGLRRPLENGADPPTRPSRRPTEDVSKELAAGRTRPMTWPDDPLPLRRFQPGSRGRTTT